MNTLITKKTAVLQKETAPKGIISNSDKNALYPGRGGDFKGSSEKEHLSLTKNKVSAFRLAVWSGVLIFAAYLLTHPRVSFNAVEGALNLCLKTLIPSLFPFMVAGELLLLSGFPDTAQRYFGKTFNKVFGLNGKGAAAFVIGAFCGFPVGAKTAASLYASGDISREDAEKLSGICNNAGLGFLVSGVGAGIWGSTKLGALIYLSQIISAILAGALLFGSQKNGSTGTAKDGYDVTHNKDFTLSTALSSAVSSASLSMLKVIGFVVFFEVMLSAFSEVLILAKANTLTVSLICAFTEISSGVKSLHTLSLLPSPLWTKAAKILTFTFSAFGGLSVYMQYCAFATPAGLGTGTYLKTKLTQAALCTLIGTALVLFGII